MIFNVLQLKTPAVRQLLEAELLYRNHRRTQTAIKNARFRYQASVEEIICSQDRNLSRETLSMLADGSYIDRGENIIISGATGCGKSFLASALGYQACMQGRKVILDRIIHKAQRIELMGESLRKNNTKKQF